MLVFLNTTYNTQHTMPSQAPHVYTLLVEHSVLTEVPSVLPAHGDVPVDQGFYTVDSYDLSQLGTFEFFDNAYRCTCANIVYQEMYINSPTSTGRYNVVTKLTDGICYNPVTMPDDGVMRPVIERMIAQVSMSDLMAIFEWPGVNKKWTPIGSTAQDFIIKKSGFSDSNWHITP